MLDARNSLTLLLASLVLLAACRPGGPDPGAGAPGVGELAGEYRSGGRIESMVLTEAGAFECFVLNGMTSFGCGTVVGAGSSFGRWRLDSGRISFHPLYETEDLVISLVGVFALPSEVGMVLTIEGAEYSIERAGAESWGADAAQRLDKLLRELEATSGD